MKRRTLLTGGAAWPVGAGADAPLLVGAAEAGDMAALRRLLDAGVPVDMRDARRRTALLAATHANRIDAARLLIERGADVNAKDEMQDSPPSTTRRSRSKLPRAWRVMARSWRPCPVRQVSGRPPTRAA